MPLLRRNISHQTMTRNELPRLKQMYVNGTVSLPVFEAMVEYYLNDCDGEGPTILGTHVPRSVDPDAVPASRPEEHPGVSQYLESE